MTINQHDVVQFAKPYPDEVGVKYTVLEINGDRCFIRAELGMTINPQSVALVSDLVPVGR